MGSHGSDSSGRGYHRRTAIEALTSAGNGAIVAQTFRCQQGVLVATIVDVARLAGVSTSTVSHVVNGTRPVNDDTRRRVLNAIQATGYRQDSVARALRRSRTDSVGLVVSDVAQPVFAEMVRG